MEKENKDNFFNNPIVIILFLILIGVSIFFILNKKSSDSNTQLLITQNKDEGSQQIKTVDTSTSSINLQAKCAKEAKDTFNDIGKTYDSYVSHYNQKLDKCFMIISSTNTKGDYSTLDILFDAISRQEYGEIYGSLDESIAIYKFILSSCVQDNKPTTICDVLKNGVTTQENWQNFIKPYMEN
jgi:hypothetical protein